MSTTLDKPRGNAVALRQQLREKKLAKFQRRAAARESVRAALPVAAPPEVNVALMLDCTASMIPFIEAAKRDMKLIAYELDERSAAAISYMLAGYRDYENKDRALVTSPLTGDVGEIVQRMEGLDPIGNWDTAEAVQLAMRTVLDSGEFTLAFLVGDAPGHSKMDLRRKGLPGVQTVEELCPEFKLRGIPVFPMVVGRDPDTIRQFEHVATATGGVCGMMDSSEQSRHAMVMAMLKVIEGAQAVRGYLSDKKVQGGALAFGKKLLIEHKK